mmetsp:Transcript_41201/g.98946  ORF Transcript_41201/g.98946 Transcript_41201/m.98946 type:complete len:358 (-) Transcript_41201:157-1230(-)
MVSAHACTRGSCLRTILSGEERLSLKAKMARPIVCRLLGASVRSRRTVAAFQRSSMTTTRAFLTSPAALSSVLASSMMSPTRSVSSPSGTEWSLFWNMAMSSSPSASAASASPSSPPWSIVLRCVATYVRPASPVSRSRLSLTSAFHAFLRSFRAHSTARKPPPCTSRWPCASTPKSSSSARCSAPGASSWCTRRTSVSAMARCSLPSDVSACDVSVTAVPAPTLRTSAAHAAQCCRYALVKGRCCSARYCGHKTTLASITSSRDAPGSTGGICWGSPTSSTRAVQPCSRRKRTRASMIAQCRFENSSMTITCAALSSASRSGVMRPAGLSLMVTLPSSSSPSPASSPSACVLIPRS